MKVDKEELQGRMLLNVLCFLNMASFLGHEVVHYFHCSLHIFELRWSVFNKIEEIGFRPATLPKKVCTKEVFL